LSEQQTPHLERGLGLMQATAVNMIDMVGIGPFITLHMIVSVMNGPASLFAWLLGALLAYSDGLVWAELGAKWPEAGGSYVFLKKLYGNSKSIFGGLMPFLLIWQTTIQAPLVIASGAIGFADYFSYLMPVADLAKKAVSGTLVILLIGLLYRNIKSVGKISVVLWAVTAFTMIWLIISGLPKFNAAQAFDFHFSAIGSTVFYAALGQASLQAVYSYLGYYNVCHLGAEIKQPERNIPRAILLSVTGIAILYIGMQTVVLGNLPWQQVAGAKYAVSLFFEYVYGGRVAAIVATLLILVIALAALFSGILGYSRIPYAAALNGDFFKIFARVHPKYKIPYVSLLAIGALGFVFSLLLRLSDVIKAILVMRILIQFVSQAVGLLIWRHRHKAERMPYKMPLFPIPAILSIVIWLFIFFTTEQKFIFFAFGIILSGVIGYFIKRRFDRNQPQPPMISE
jgi:fructoselysine transporter